jgi:pantothenate kinase-related protein Tda10
MDLPYFNTLENAQNVSKITAIFSKNQPEYTLKPNPLLVILIGSPGVGKTTKAKEFIKRELDAEYEHFYNISLDSLIERVRPYRKVTRNLHATIKNIKSNSNLTNENYKNLSEVYLTTIMSKKEEFQFGEY